MGAKICTSHRGSVTGGLPSVSPPVTGRSGALAFPEAPTGGGDVVEDFIDDVG